MDDSLQDKSKAELVASRPISRYENDQSDGEEPIQKVAPLEAPVKSDSLRASDKNFRVASEGLNLNPKNLKFYQVAPLSKIRSNFHSRSFITQLNGPGVMNLCPFWCKKEDCGLCSSPGIWVGK